MSLADLRVTQKAGGANFSVDVSAGRCVVQGDSATLQGNYMATNDATVNDSTTAVTSAPSAGNERYDIVIVEIKDNAEDSGGINAPRFRVVAGTPQTVASGTAAPPATPVTSLRLAVIGPIQNGTTTITNAIIAQDNTLAGRRCTPGTVEQLAGTHVPTGWLSCDGSAVSRSTYARLFAEIGTSYGVGNGSTTFNLPNLRGKLPIARLASQAEVDTIGETGGAYSKTLAIGEIPAHEHPLVNGGGLVVGQQDATGPTGLQINASASGNPLLQYKGQSAGSGTAFSLMNPYQVIGLSVIRT